MFVKIVIYDFIKLIFHKMMTLQT